MVILDTNVISEVLRPLPSTIVGDWMKEQTATSLFTTAVCEAELSLGAALLAQGRRRNDFRGRVNTAADRTADLIA
jgi:predicted nucleic acid-binding protein